MDFVASASSELPQLHSCWYQYSMCNIEHNHSTWRHQHEIHRQTSLWQRHTPTHPNEKRNKQEDNFKAIVMTLLCRLALHSSLTPDYQFWRQQLVVRCTNERLIHFCCQGSTCSHSNRHNRMKNRTVHNGTKKQDCFLDQEWEILSLSYFLPKETFLKVLRKQYKKCYRKAKPSLKPSAKGPNHESIKFQNFNKCLMVNVFKYW